MHIQIFLVFSNQTLRPSSSNKGTDNTWLTCWCLHCVHSCIYTILEEQKSRQRGLSRYKLRNFMWTHYIYSLQRIWFDSQDKNVTSALRSAFLFLRLFLSCKTHSDTGATVKGKVRTPKDITRSVEQMLYLGGLLTGQPITL